MIEAPDQTLVISLPYSHELAQPVDGKNKNGVFKSKAVAYLVEAFRGDLWTLREGLDGQCLELKVAVRTARAEEFRARIAKLGFTEVAKKR
ncbi:hypothetical protein KJ657_01615 [Patescibacteria group bacterium]|nr:hypothetical protein [Patescibacteria group bacterium]MBU1015766.1 hypothetical protein [Patescibacteria group bacterium]MBU1685174.1 hypothetical protein [Patescibacteria group bacterium]MBU1938310.1 hypothetical protein [Patescibacteria group bacterium]